MKVLVVDNAANPDIEVIFDICSRLVEDPEIQVRFSKHCEDAIDYAQWFQPSTILFTSSPHGAENERLIQSLHDLVPQALMLYLDRDQFYVHSSTFMEPGVRPQRFLEKMPTTALHDLAIAVAISAPGAA